jgi:hypothetical protein
MLNGKRSSSKIAVCILFILFFQKISFSQQMQIEGNIIDTNTHTGVKNVKAFLVNMRDSIIQAHRTTDENGNFQFSNIPLDTFRMILEHPKYETRELIFLGHENNYTFELKDLVLFERGKKMEEITIFAYKDPVYYKGDTLVYIADSFKTRPNAVVEDLLKKLPGITVESDGSIKSQGKNVARVYVDGDEFFGSDATLATKNLAASSIETVQVYETALPNSEAGDEKVQVIDLKLKDEAKKGYFGKASFGTDFNRFYEGQLLANKFNKKQKISVYFLSANTTKSALTWSEANEYGVQQGGAYNYNAETDSWEVNDNFISSDDGFPLMFKSGFYYTDQVSKKLKIGANYTYNDFRKSTENTSNSTFFLPDTTYSNRSVNKDFNRYNQHEANLSLTYDIDSTQTLVFEPKFNFSTRKTESSYISDFINADGISNRNSTNSSIGESDATNIKTKLAYTKNFKKEKRQLRLLNNFVYDNSNSNSNLLYSDYFMQTGVTENGIDQQKNSERDILSNVFSAAYVEPLSKKLKLEFMYEIFNTTNEQDKRSFNKVNGIYDDIDSLTSGDFKSIKFQNRLGATLIYDYKKHMISIGAFGRNVAIENQNHFLQNNIKQNVTNILPKFMHVFRISRNSSLRTNISTNSVLPSITLLQPVRDNSNPNNISIGNANLKPNYTVNLNVNYNTYNPLSGGYIYAGGYGNYGFNEFISTIIYDSLGRSINSYQNGNSFNYAGMWVGGGIPLVKQVLTLNPQVNYNHSNRFNYVNGEQNRLNSHNLETSLDLELYTDVVEFSFGVSYTRGQNSNSISSNLNLVNNTYGLNSELRGYLPWNMEIGTDFQYNNYNNLSEEFNINTFIWNAEIEQNLGKNKNWGIALRAYDMLNQNTRINRGAYANRVTDSRTAIIARYFLFSLSYKFNSTFKKPSKTETDEVQE